MNLKQLEAYNFFIMGREDNETMIGKGLSLDKIKNHNNFKNSAIFCKFQVEVGVENVHYLA